jgi:hypothetical protein
MINKDDIKKIKLNKINTTNTDKIKEVESNNYKNKVWVADAMMNIKDEDGQPLYSQDWINKRILGV